MAAKPKKKLVIGWFTFTCSEDNSILFVELMNEHFFEWKEKIEFRHCKLLKPNNVLKDLDVAFIEGAISSEKDAKKLKEIRKNSKNLVPVGSCACTGMPAGQRNLFDKKLKEKIKNVLRTYELNENVQPVKNIVKIDDEVPGCPMNEKLFLEILDKYFKKFGVK